jgi:hypothetical protein
MTPFDKAIVWQREHSTETFEELLAWHLRHGLVHSTPSVFLLAHEAHYSPDTNTMTYDLPANTWFVPLAAATGHANPIAEFLRIVGRPHQFAAWCRHNAFRIHAYPWAKLAARVGLGGATSVSSVASEGRVA